MHISDYINSMPEIKQMLDSSYKNNRLSHAYIFSGDKGVGKEAMALYFTALLYSDGEVDYNSTTSNQIFNHDFLNLYEIYPSRNEIKKDDVEALMLEFSKTSLQEGERVFIIHDADRLNPKSSNMLLKFIEEPPTGVHGILLTSNLSNILPTIISRCNIVSFKAKDKSLLYKELIDNGIPNDFASIIKEFTNNLEEGISLFEDDMFKTSLDYVLKLLDTTKEIDGLMLTNDNIAYLSNASNMRIVLNMLSLFLEDMLYDTPNRFKEYKEIISRYKKRNNNDKIKERLKCVLDYIKMIDANVQSKNVAYMLEILMFR